MRTYVLRCPILMIAGIAMALEVASAEDAKVDEKSAGDMKQLEGEWRFVEVEAEGKPISLNGKTTWKARRMIFQANNMTTTSGRPGAGDRKKTFKLDATQSPKALDMTALDGNETGMTAACIYALDGDQLKLCIPYFYNRVDPSKRPTEFKTKDGDGLMLYVLERVKQGSP